jgi:tRNA pseudouridine38-40 synthase
MRSFRLVLSYDGTAYGGWQRQANAPTIQAELERALAKIVGQPVRAVASSRTDAGVHALGQLVSFACETRLEADVLRRALNANLPRDIVVREVGDAPPGFHAIRDTVRKRYRYIVQDGPMPDAFARAYSWFVPQRLDVPAMQAAAAALIGTHDFRSFESAGSPRESSVRTVSDLAVRRQAGEFLDRVVIEIQADGFLYNMVRNIVGTLVQVGRHRECIGWVAEVLAARDRTRAGMCAPPQGLFLVEVDWREWGT